MPDEDRTSSNQMLLSKSIFLRCREIVVDFIVFDMPEFDIIMRMDFLSHYGMEIDCRKKKVWFYLDDKEEFTFGEDHMLSMMVNNIKTRKMLSEGCMRYLTHIVNKVDELVLSLQNAFIVCEF